MTFDEIVDSIKIEPYYLDREYGQAIYCGDSKDILPLIPAGSIDLVLTDPPYNVGINYGDSVNDSKIDYDLFCRSWFIEAKKLSTLILLTPGVVNFQDWIIREKATWIASWQISNGCSRGGQIQFITWEPILIYGVIHKKVNRDTYNIPLGMQSDTGNHPCPKPKRLWDLIILDYSESGQIILDPFLGSGTTAYCAKKLNRKCIGIEINSDYCKIAKDRLRQSVMRLE